MPPAYLWRFRPLKQVALDIQDWLMMLAAVNILWFMLSLTVILLPPATLALYDVAYAAYRGRYPTPRLFLSSVLERLFVGWGWGIVNSFVLLFAITTARYYYALATPTADFFRGVVIFVTVAFFALQFYFLPYLAMQEKPTIYQAARNALFTTFADPFLLLLNGGIAFIILVPAVVIVAPLILIVPIAIALLATYSLLGWLTHHGLIDHTLETNQPQD